MFLCLTHPAQATLVLCAPSGDGTFTRSIPIPCYLIPPLYAIVFPSNFVLAHFEANLPSLSFTMLWTTLHDVFKKSQMALVVKWNSSEAMSGIFDTQITLQVITGSLQVMKPDFSGTGFDDFLLS